MDLSVSLTIFSWTPPAQVDFLVLHCTLELRISGIICVSTFRSKVSFDAVPLVNKWLFSPTQAWWPIFFILCIEETTTLHYIYIKIGKIFHLADFEMFSRNHFYNLVFIVSLGACRCWNCLAIISLVHLFQ